MRRHSESNQLIDYRDVRQEQRGWRKPYFARMQDAKYMVVGLYTRIRDYKAKKT